MKTKVEEFLNSTTALRKLITKYPKLPLVVSVRGEAINDDFDNSIIDNISFYKGEVLCVVLEEDEDKVYTDRDEVEERIIDILVDKKEYEKLSDM